MSAICAAVAASSSIVDVVSATADDCWVALAACSSAVASSSPALEEIWSPPERIWSTSWRRLSSVLLNESVSARTESFTAGPVDTVTARSPSAARASTDDSSSTRRLSSSRSSAAVRRSSQTAAHSMPTNQVTPGPSGRTRTRKLTSCAVTGPATAMATAVATVAIVPIRKLRRRDIETAAMSSGAAISAQ